MPEDKIKLIKLTKSPKADDRFYAQFDNGDAFTVTIAHIADFDLFTGAKLDMDSFRELSYDAERSKVKSRALRMMSTRPMSKGEIVEKLTQKGEREEMAQEVALWLEEIGAINEEDYSRTIVSHYAQKGYGAGKIRNELYKRKIPRDLWDEAMETMPEDESIIDRLVESRLKNREPDRKEIKKVSDMLLRRGYSYEEVRGALRRFVENLED